MSMPPAGIDLPTIRALRVRTVSVPLPEPHRTASGVIAAAPLVLTDLHTDAGATGRSITFTYTPLALAPTADLLRRLEPLVAGQRLDPAALGAQLLQRFRLLGAQGLLGMALAGLDMALWDALARWRGLSLAALLGGTPRPTPAYGGVGFDGADGSARAAEAWARRGFRGVKAKIGYPTVEEDLAVVRAMRQAVGPDLEVMVDYNQSLSVDEALARLAVLDGEGLAWVEEPTLAADHAGHGRIARAVETPIQCGENWWGPVDFRQALALGASDLLMPDVMKVGGVSGWLEVAALAADARLPVCSHLWPELSAQLLACTPTAHRLEYVDWWNPVLAGALRVEGGLALPDESPGSGIAWDEAAVARHAA